MRVLRVDELTERLGISRTTVWRMQRRGEFPAPRQLSPNAVGWLESEVLEWMESRPIATGAGGGAADRD